MACCQQNLNIVLHRKDVIRKKTFFCSSQESVLGWGNAGTLWFCWKNRFQGATWPTSGKKKTVLFSLKTNQTRIKYMKCTSKTVFFVNTPEKTGSRESRGLPLVNNQFFSEPNQSHSVPFKSRLCIYTWKNRFQRTTWPTSGKKPVLFSLKSNQTWIKSMKGTSTTVFFVNTPEKTGSRESRDLP